MRVAQCKRFTPFPIYARSNMLSQTNIRISLYMELDRFEKQARDNLKFELKRKDVTYAALSSLLADNGLMVSEYSIANRINGGAFSYAFYLTCLHVLAGISVPKTF